MMEYDVIIMGAGPSGLAAAQELAEKGLKVCVLEAAPFIGGKPISAFMTPFTPPPHDGDLVAYLRSPPTENQEIKTPLPIEHGFRVYPENYWNLLDLMKRIPLKEGGVVSDLFTNAIHLSKYIKEIPPNRGWKNHLLAKLEMIFFGLSLYLPYIVSEERSFKFDELSIDDLFKLEKRSPELQDFIFRLTDSLSSGMMTKTSSLAVINILMNYMDAPNRTGFRTFNRPTHLAWLEPWEDYLIKLGVTFHKETKVTGFTFEGITETHFDGISISEVIAIHKGEEKKFRASYVISALPADALLRIVQNNYEMLRYDPRLIDLTKITTLPATGVQLYYETPIPEMDKKLLAGSMITHPWGISYVDQSSYWKDPTKYTKGYGVISIYTAITNQAGRFIPKTMQKCTANEIAYEMFTEVETEWRKRGIQIPKRIGYAAHAYQEIPRMTHPQSPSITHHFFGSIEEDQLHLCTVGMYKWRPLPETIYLNNLILVGAYTRTKNYYPSTMEAAAESGRRGANTILKQFAQSPVPIHKITPPRGVRWLRALDSLLWKCHLPNPIDLFVRLLRRLLDTSSLHMDPKIRDYENLHW